MANTKNLVLQDDNNYALQDQARGALQDHHRHVSGTREKQNLKQISKQNLKQFFLGGGGKISGSRSSAESQGWGGPLTLTLPGEELNWTLQTA